MGGVLGYLRSLQTKIDNQLGVAMQIGMDESKSASERVRANKDAVKYAKAKKAGAKERNEHWRKCSRG